MRYKLELKDKGRRAQVCAGQLTLPVSTCAALLSDICSVKVKFGLIAYSGTTSHQSERLRKLERL